MSTREEINTQAGPCHDLAWQILGTDWYNTESAARRVIEWIVTQPIALWQYRAADGSWWNIRAEWVELAKRDGFPVRQLYAAPRPAEVAGDAVRAGDATLLNEQAALLRECRASLDSLIEQKPSMAGLRAGSTTLGNLRASLWDYRPQGIFGGTGASK